MELIQRISDYDLARVGGHLTDMVEDILRYLSRKNLSGGNPYNAINDGVPDQHHDFVSYYLKIKEILEPYYKKYLGDKQKSKVDKLKEKIKELEEIIGDME